MKQNINNKQSQTSKVYRQINLQKVEILINHEQIFENDDNLIELI